MMTNLFSTFDPATSMNLSLSWSSTWIWTIIIPMTYWVSPSRFSQMFKVINKIIISEFKITLKSKNLYMNMFTSMFIFIMINNMMGLLPYVFTSTSHLMMSMSLALPLWLSLMIFGWINQTDYMFSHLVPQGSPGPLMPFMVLIETISNLIRPGSLAVRLTANMIAGHLIMSLLGNNMMTASTIMMIMLLMIQMMIMLFELAVSIIQAYVFSTLLTLYTSEIPYENK